MIEDYDKKRLLCNIVENPLFDVFIEDIRTEYARKMLESNDEKAREAIYYENKALTSIVGRLTAIANEVRMSNG